MTARPRLLFLCQNLPFPPDGGVKIRSHHLLRQLVRAFDVTALCFTRRDSAGGGDVARALNELGRLCPVEAFPIPQEVGRTRFLWDHARSVARARVYTYYLYQSRAFLARATSVGSQCDLIHCDSLDLSASLDGVDPRRVVCGHHNVESSLLRRRADRERSAARRGYIGYQSTLMRREEELWCPKVLLNVAVSQLDEQELRARIPQGAFTTIPNGVDTDFFQPMPSTDRLIVSAGGMTWFPNRDGLEFFVADILPRIRAQERDCPVRWVGRAGESERAEYRERHDVELTGYVDDIRPYIGAAACFVVPLRVGGGTRLKILDAWAMGKPVVSTSIGCEGLGAVDGDNILIRDDPGEFADAVLSVLRDASLRDRIGRRGRETAEREYSWNSIGGELIRTYRELL